jgi:hypothetical protein
MNRTEALDRRRDKRFTSSTAARRSSTPDFRVRLFDDGIACLVSSASRLAHSTTCAPSAPANGNGKADPSLEPVTIATSRGLKSRLSIYHFCAAIWQLHENSARGTTMI